MNEKLIIKKLSFIIDLNSKKEKNFRQRTCLNEKS